MVASWLRKIPSSGAALVLVSLFVLPVTYGTSSSWYKVLVLDETLAMIEPKIVVSATSDLLCAMRAEPDPAVNLFCPKQSGTCYLYDLFVSSGHEDSPNGPTTPCWTRNLQLTNPADPILTSSTSDSQETSTAVTTATPGSTITTALQTTTAPEATTTAITTTTTAQTTTTTTTPQTTTTTTAPETTTTPITTTTPPDATTTAPETIPTTTPPQTTTTNPAGTTSTTTTLVITTALQTTPVPEETTTATTTTPETTTTANTTKLQTTTAAITPTTTAPQSTTTATTTTPKTTTTPITTSTTNTPPQTTTTTTTPETTTTTTTTTTQPTCASPSVVKSRKTPFGGNLANVKAVCEAEGYHIVTASTFNLVLDTILDATWEKGESMWLGVMSIGTEPNIGAEFADGTILTKDELDAALMGRPKSFIYDSGLCFARHAQGPSIVLVDCSFGLDLCSVACVSCE